MIAHKNYLINMVIMLNDPIFCSNLVNLMFVNWNENRVSMYPFILFKQNIEED